MIVTLLFTFVFPPILTSAKDLVSNESGRELLSTYILQTRPWLNLEANSEQRQPLYLGATPRELELKLRPIDQKQARIPQPLLDLGIIQIKALEAALISQGFLENNHHEFELEVWPARNDRGQLTWTLARWRFSGAQNWLWPDGNELEKSPAIQKLEVAPFLPKIYFPWKKEDHSKIFEDTLKMEDLYDKPLFADCVWSSLSSGNVQEAWLPVASREQYEVKLKQNTLCRYLPQPVRWNGKATSFVVQVRGDSVVWPKVIVPKSELLRLPPVKSSRPVITSWPEDFKDSYLQDIKILSGAQPVSFRQNQKQINLRFTKKNSAEKDHQLEIMADYLESRYRELKITTERFRFTWLGLPQSNLIAKIKGHGKLAAKKPILLADHYDTAFCQDVYDATGDRVAAPGADDNYSATAALLRAASILKKMKFKNDIWLVHFTGEEFPADDLGARKFVSEMLKAKKDIGGLVLLDMIGHRENNDDWLFQINPGDSEASLKLAATAMDASKTVSTLTPALRTRFDSKGYLYNTDGLIFSDNGYPVVFFNEHINYEENLERVGYHDTKDTVDGRPADFLVQGVPKIEGKRYHSGIDSKYATDIAKIAIETVARLALPLP
ncbi:MAG TPA: hypothetical protein DCY86_11015 [Bdellovibrionales bacterium]|nr:hypothetical protein [Bdellovibrionales bacterium]